MQLNEIMQFDHVIQILDDGSLIEPTGIYAPEVWVCTDGDGQVLDAHEVEMRYRVNEQGWDLLSGFTGQWHYNGPIMHGSEYIGGGLEKHIRETPGYYCAVSVSTDDGELTGWAVAYRENL